MDEVKKCRKCGKMLNTKFFDPDRLGKYGVASTCRECKKKNKKTYVLKKTEVKKIGKRRIDRIKNGGSEVKVFEKINEIDKTCWVCGCLVNTTASYTYPHILNKKDHPALRVLSSNIARSCSIEHHDRLDEIITIIKRDFKEKKKLESLILKLDRLGVKEMFIKYKSKKTIKKICN